MLSWISGCFDNYYLWLYVILDGGSSFLTTVCSCVIVVVVCDCNLRGAWALVESALLWKLGEGLFISEARLGGQKGAVRADTNAYLDTPIYSNTPVLYTHRVLYTAVVIPVFLYHLDDWNFETFFTCGAKAA